MIAVKYEAKRGCGYRKSGGLYLISGGPVAHCCRLPIKLEICPCCHAGIKFSRGWTWIDIDMLLKDTPSTGGADCEGCLLGSPIGKKVGLIWVGEASYKTPADFTNEAAKMGISRRIAAIPQQFKIGETVVCFAHKKAINTGTQEKPEYISAIFGVYRPHAIEYVVKGDESQEKLDSLESRGISLVKVINP